VGVFVAKEGVHFAGAHFVVAARDDFIQIDERDTGCIRNCLRPTGNLGEKRRVQLRVDALNVLNHPILRLAGNVGGGTDVFQNYPSLNWTAATLQSVYSSWQAANPTSAFPISDPRAAAALAAFQSMILGTQNSKAVLPADFYTVPLPKGFITTPANSFDIRTLAGFKDYEIRNNTNTGGTLTYNTRLNQQRYLQFGIKFIF
jgi:hypothetical protein